MSNRPLRKRIPYRKPIGLESMPENLDFTPNKCSSRSRKIVVIDNNLTIEIWFNKHYYDRYYPHDEKDRRKGIEPDKIESLVKRSIKHLFWYSTVVGSFNFVNYEVARHFPKRVVLLETVEGSTLNVVIEVHYLSLTRYEVTVITAMVADNFKIAAGQFWIEIKHEHSCLKRIDDGKVLDLCRFRFA
jgi:hypothetical protein